LFPRHPNHLRPAVLALGIRLLAAGPGWLLSPAFAFAGPDNTPRSFRVQAGPASETLKQFAEQAQREILFPSEPLADVRTPRVFGDYPPREALDRLLTGTRLRAREAPETGGFVISTAANTPPQARPDNSPSTITTTSPMKKTSMLTALISQLGLAVAPLTTTASAAAPTPATEQTIRLTAFEVASTRDSGYRATNSVSGTRVNMKLMDVPQTISVLTSDFIQAIGATDLDDPAEGAG
jgi:hypothetical protein